MRPLGFERWPPHLWTEPYREVMAQTVTCYVAFFVKGRDEARIAAAEELVLQGYLAFDVEYCTYGQTYQRYKPTSKLDVRELRHAY